MHVNGNEIIFDSTMLGSMDQPRAPRSIFRKALAHIEGVNPDEIFDQIAHRNRLALVQLLREITSLEGRAVQMIREACWDQLISIGFHIGSREIPEEWDQAAT